MMFQRAGREGELEVQQGPLLAQQEPPLPMREELLLHQPPAGRVLLPADRGVAGDPHPSPGEQHGLAAEGVPAVLLPDTLGLLLLAGGPGQEREEGPEAAAAEHTDHHSP